ncbi:ABC transporter permease [Conexibacter woesei]|uniref:Binding-protein-dependent transport systems inner membrane component n=1 Tax=Conexibacter woesei (strain DSM 14684 / CCUG 47730 / CIP 108061 / JCM 11494 / NBRC 100937 / ID131577) TaxID=469383 RepID=D3F8D4_CONWI|nr:ABC transporter permease [Conexibacter woesei]ADB49004.1 binding-protein-dependent transport systems inner membrane component [Conexibacter woesei DSM 14684]
MARPGRIALWAFGVLVGLWLILPTLVVIPVGFSERASFAFPPDGLSLRWYRNFFEDPAWIGALGNSLLIGLLSAALATVLGTAAALGLARWSSRRGRPVTRALLLSPLVLPGIVIAIAIYAVFLKLRLLGTVQGFVLAHAMLGMPLVLVAVTASLEGFDARLERAAASLGAGPWATARQVTLPLIAPGVLSGALFAFMTSFDEVMVALFIKSPYLETLPVKMFASMSRDVDPTIAAAASLILALTTTVLLSAAVGLARRGRRAGGRLA